MNSNQRIRSILELPPINLEQYNPFFAVQLSRNFNTAKVYVVKLLDKKQQTIDLHISWLRNKKLPKRYQGTRSKAEWEKILVSRNFSSDSLRYKSPTYLLRAVVKTQNPLLVKLYDENIDYIIEHHKTVLEDFFLQLQYDLRKYERLTALSFNKNKPTSESVKTTSRNKTILA